MKRLAVIILFVFLAILIPFAWWYSEVFLDLKLFRETTTSFTVFANESADSVISRLPVSRSLLAVKIYIRLFNLATQLKPGVYELSLTDSPAKLIKILTAGPPDIRVTIPEGWRREQIAARLEVSLPAFSAADFTRLTASLEGQLFPDTYNFPPLSTAEAVIEIFLTNFHRKSGLILPRDRDTLILASLIEREVKSDEDRKFVASVLSNRLRLGLALQVDATVQYARDSGNFKFWEPIYDTKYPSAYNTYLHPGLPPAPIANPGLASIRAAQNPPSTDYLYYLTGRDGLTRFASTLEEHNLNIDKYLRP